MAKKYELRFCPSCGISVSKFREQCYNCGKIFNDDEEQTALQTVDITLIKQLRIQGRYEEAEQMLEAFQDSVKREKEQLRKELVVQRRMKKKAKNLCTTHGCKNSTAGTEYITCEDCRTQRQKYK